MADARFDIWAVLEHYGWDLPLARGVWQTIKCHAHDDSHMSCRVSADSGHVKCLACGFAGDAINVVQHYEGVNYRDAVRRCEEITGRGDAHVSRSSQSRDRLSSGSRYQQRGRKYVPPRLRERPDDRA